MEILFPTEPALTENSNTCSRFETNYDLVSAGNNL